MVGGPRKFECASLQQKVVRSDLGEARHLASGEVHDLHPDASVNFQMNRFFYGWVGDDSMLTEMAGRGQCA